MRGTLFCIVQHLANAVPRKTIGRPLFCIVQHLPNVVPSRTMQNNAIPIVLLGTARFSICQTPNNEMQRYTIPPPVNDLPGSVIIIQFTHTGATPPPPLAIHTPNNVKKI